MGEVRRAVREQVRNGANQSAFFVHMLLTYSALAEECTRLGWSAAMLGKLHLVNAGAWADLLVVDGDPVQGLQMQAAPDSGIQLLLKAGRVLRSTL